MIPWYPYLLGTTAPFPSSVLNLHIDVYSPQYGAALIQSFRHRWWCKTADSWGCRNLLVIQFGAIRNDGYRSAQAQQCKILQWATIIGPSNENHAALASSADLEAQKGDRGAAARQARMKVETQNFLKKGYSAKGSKRILWHACLQLQERRKAGAMRIAHTHRTLWHCTMHKIRSHIWKADVLRPETALHPRP
jgi:hypothetical protein